MIGHKHSPKVSVILSVYNGEKYLCEAIDSILNQTLTDFEFIIVDDCSTDASATIVERYDDQRIRLVKNCTNQGLSNSLNRALALARGEYVARMDADDISLCERLEKQSKFLDEAPSVVALGSAYECFGEGPSYVVYPYKSHHHMRARLLFNPPIAHPTAMVRRDFLEKIPLRYDPSCRFAQDYDFWSRLFGISGTIGANLPDALLKYRKHGGQTTKVTKAGQKETSYMVRQREIRALGLAPNDSDLVLHERIAELQWGMSKHDMLIAEKWLNRLQDANKDSQHHEVVALQDILSAQWLNLCLNNTRLGIWLFLKHIRSRYTKGCSLRDYARLLAKCMLRWAPSVQNI